MADVHLLPSVSSQERPVKRYQYGLQYVSPPSGRLNQMTWGESSSRLSKRVLVAMFTRSKWVAARAAARRLKQEIATTHPSSNVPRTRKPSGLHGPTPTVKCAAAIPVNWIPVRARPSRIE